MDCFLTQVTERGRIRSRGAGDTANDGYSSIGNNCSLKFSDGSTAQTGDEVMFERADPSQYRTLEGYGVLVGINPTSKNKTILPAFVRRKGIVGRDHSQPSSPTCRLSTLELLYLQRQVVKLVTTMPVAAVKVPPRVPVVVNFPSIFTLCFPTSLSRRLRTRLTRLVFRIFQGFLEKAEVAAVMLEWAVLVVAVVLVAAEVLAVALATTVVMTGLAAVIMVTMVRVLLVVAETVLVLVVLVAAAVEVVVAAVAVLAVAAAAAVIMIGMAAAVEAETVVVVAAVIKVEVDQGRAVGFRVSVM